MQKINIFWFRRDLRLSDNTALYHALKIGSPVLPIFIFDTDILNELDRNDARVEFIYLAIQQIQEQLVSFGSSIKVFHDSPIQAFKELMKEFDIHAVFTNHDYEPYARQRDEEIKNYLNGHGIEFNTYKDQVVFEKAEVVKDDGLPYTVFTPYSKKWKARLQPSDLNSYDTLGHASNFMKIKHPFIFPSLNDLGFTTSNMNFPNNKVLDKTIANYHLQRDIPSIEGTSQLSVHLRFGTISIRELTRQAKSLNEKFLNELIWRDFYQQILWHFPHVVNQAFKPAYDKIKWVNNEKMFKAWCEGQTGYPIVDAGMRQLNATGWMHNRVRMVVASFLTKHLLIDWRWGETYFAKKLLDFDLASNNGGWQWAAGSGVDAAPYFRIFNPYLQTLKFDPQLNYIRKWVPEFEEFNYPKPIVVHEIAREKCLIAYKAALNNE